MRPHSHELTPDSRARVADMKTKLENALAELKSTQETLERVRQESNRKTEAIQNLTLKCSKLTLELKIAEGGPSSP